MLRGMSRHFPPLPADLMRAVDDAWGQPQPDWARKRLLVIRMIAKHEFTADEIAEFVGVSRKSVFNYRDLLLEGGVEALLTRGWAGARTPTVRGPVAEELADRLGKGCFRTAEQAQQFVRKRTKKTLSLPRVRAILRKLGGRPKTPRKSHARKDPQKAAEFRRELPQRLRELLGEDPGAPVRLWVLDEHRYGLLPVIGRVWGKRGVRVHAPYATKYEWGYLHEALEVDGAHRAELLFTNSIDQELHACFLRQIAATDPQAIHVIIADQAGFHLRSGDERIPANVRLLPLPPYSPELNPVERFGGLLKAATRNRLYGNLGKLERHLYAVARRWMEPAAVGGLIHDWLLDQANCGDPA